MLTGIACSTAHLHFDASIYLWYSFEDLQLYPRLEWAGCGRTSHTTCPSRASPFPVHELGLVHRSFGWSLKFTTNSEVPAATEEIFRHDYVARQ